MLEVQANFEQRSKRFSVELLNIRRTYVCSFSLQLQKGVVQKRLVRLDCPGLMELQANVDLLIDSCALVRVSEAFALERMYRRLRSLHPFYKAGVISSASVSNQADLGFGTGSALQIDKVWTDYNDLFESIVALGSYDNWNALFANQIACNSAPSASALKRGPLISIVMPVYNTDLIFLRKAIESVRRQSYGRWELCISDDASSDVGVRELLNAFAIADQRIKIVFRERNGHISAASNSAISIATGEWFVLFDHDDELAFGALSQIVEVARLVPGCKLIYSDEDKIDESGRRSDPYFKPDWNPDLFLSQNMFSHLGAYRADLVRAVGGFRVGYEGSQDYDLALRCMERIRPDQIVHIPRVLYHWRIHADSTAHTMDAKPYAMLAGERALNDHLQRTGVDARAEAVGYGYRVRYALPATPPLVSLIIPTRNGLKLLRQCVESIFAKTDYPCYEIIIVDNGSDEKATLRYLEALSTRPNVRVMRDDRPFNYSALNNAAVAQARGEVVGLLNNDLEVIDAGWLTELVSHALRPGVGAVGARLWYSDDTLQHAGVVLGIHGVAGHVHRFLPRGNVGYCGRAALIQSFSAVTGACLVVRKSLYEEVGGLNEVDLTVACNDIDFCLKLKVAGYRNVWTPYAELYHHESASRGLDDTPEKLARSAMEVAYMKQHWGDLLANDPAYNPNLTLDAEDFSLAWPPRLPEFDAAFGGTNAPGSTLQNAASTDVKATAA